MKSSLRLPLLSSSILLLASLLAVGCGDAEEESVRVDSARTAAPVAPSTGPAAAFKAGMIDLSKRLLEVADGVNSVADAEAAEPKLAKIMQDITALLDNLAAGIDGMSEADMSAIEAMQSDPDLQEWTRKVNERMATLAQEHPDASKKLQEIGRRQSEKMGIAMQGLVQKMDQKMHNLKGETGSAPENGGRDDAAGGAGDNRSGTDTAN